MDRRRRAARTVALMSLFTMTDTQTDVPIASFDGDGSDLISLIVGIEPVQAGSGDPSPDNVRPISGWTGATVKRTGINVWGEETESGRISASGQPSESATWIRTKNFISIKPNTAYYCKSPNNIQLFWYDAEQNFLSYANWGTGAITSPSNACYMKFHIDPTYGTTYNHDISINYPSTDTGYHSGADNETYSITFPTEAGTVYGGTLDVTTGKLTVDRAEKNIQISGGNYNPSINAMLFYSSLNLLADAKPPVNNNTAINGIADSVVINSASGINGGAYGIGLSVSKDIYLKVAGVSSKEDYESLFPNGINICFELATPIEYTLTPTQVTTLIGTNNIWADTGDIKYIEYNI